MDKKDKPTSTQPEIISHGGRRGEYTPERMAAAQNAAVAAGIRGQPLSPDEMIATMKVRGKKDTVIWWKSLKIEQRTAYIQRLYEEHKREKEGW